LLISLPSSNPQIFWLFAAVYLTTTETNTRATTGATTRATARATTGATNRGNQQGQPVRDSPTWGKL
jgi:hypothetical protein